MASWMTAGFIGCLGLGLMLAFFAAPTTPGFGTRVASVQDEAALVQKDIAVNRRGKEEAAQKDLLPADEEPLFTDEEILEAMKDARAADQKAIASEEALEEMHEKLRELGRGQTKGEARKLHKMVLRKKLAKHTAKVKNDKVKEMQMLNLPEEDRDDPDEGGVEGTKRIGGQTRRRTALKVDYNVDDMLFPWKQASFTALQTDESADDEQLSEEELAEEEEYQKDIKTLHDLLQTDAEAADPIDEEPLFTDEEILAAMKDARTADQKAIAAEEALEEMREKLKELGRGQTKGEARKLHKMVLRKKLAKHTAKVKNDKVKEMTMLNLPEEDRDDPDEGGMEGMKKIGGNTRRRTALQVNFDVDDVLFPWKNSGLGQ